MDLYDLHSLYRSGEIIAEIQRHAIKENQCATVSFETNLDVKKIEMMFNLGKITYTRNKIGLQRTLSSTISKLNPNVKATSTRQSVSSINFQINPEHKATPQNQSQDIPQTNPSLRTRPKLLSTVSFEAWDDKNGPDPYDIEVFNIGGTITLAVLDFENLSVKSYYTKDNRMHCTSLKFGNKPATVTKISHNMIAISFISFYYVELINLTPDPVRVHSIKTKKEYRCLSALSDTTFAATCVSPPSIDVLDLSGRVLRSVITPTTGQQLIQKPRYMCTTRQGNIVVTDKGSHSVYCMTQQGELLFSHVLTGRRHLPWGGVATSGTGSVIVVDHWCNKILELKETGEFVRDLLTSDNGIQRPQGICIHGDKLYVTEHNSRHIKVFQL